MIPFLLGERRARSGSDFDEHLIVHMKYSNNSRSLLILAVRKKNRLAPRLNALDINPTARNSAHLLCMDR